MPISIFVRIQDAGPDDGTGKPGTSLVTCELHPETAFANLTNAVEAFALLVEPLILGQIVGAGFTIEVPVSGVIVGAAADVFADIQEKAVFAFRTAGGFLKKISIPTFNEGLFVGGGSSGMVDITDPDVAAFVDGMIDGIDLAASGGLGLVAVVDTRDDDVAQLESASQLFVNRRG
jgi:hypothetical protein